MAYAMARPLPGSPWAAPRCLAVRLEARSVTLWKRMEYREDRVLVARARIEGFQRRAHKLENRVLDADLRGKASWLIYDRLAIERKRVVMARLALHQAERYYRSATEDWVELQRFGR